MAFPPRRRTAGMVVAIALIAGACTSASESTTRPADISPATTGPAGTAVPDSLAALPGALIIENGTELRVTKADGTEAISLPASVEGSQPTWSPDGRRVAWSILQPSGLPGVAIAEPGAEPELHDAAFLPFYYSWSPSGAHLGMLGSGASGTIEFSILEPTTRSFRTVGSGSPFYFDWAPDGDLLVAHIGASELRTIDVDSGDVRQAVPSSGQFQAPQWIDEGILFQQSAPSSIRARGLALQSTTGQRLVIGDLSGDARELARIDGFGSFQATASRVAYLTASQDPDRTGSDLWVIDSESPGVRVNSTPVFAFQWSPDGEQLLFLEADGLRLRWAVWSDDEVLVFPAFDPTPGFFLRYLPFWDQYNRSMSIWSPDSAAFVYSARVDGDAGEIFVQIISRDRLPQAIGEGEFASWSP